MKKNIIFIFTLCLTNAAASKVSAKEEETPSRLSSLPIRVANREDLMQESGSAWQYLGGAEEDEVNADSRKKAALRRDNRVDQRFFENGGGRYNEIDIDSAPSVPFLTSMMPSLPSSLIGFSLVRAKNESLSGPGRDRVAFEHVFTDVNGAWDEERAAFRCTKSGLYFFAFNARGKADDDDKFWMVSLMLNGVEVVSIGGRNESSSSNSILLPLNAHDQVWLQTRRGRILEDFDLTKTGTTTFSGFRIGGMGMGEENEVTLKGHINVSGNRRKGEVGEGSAVNRRRPWKDVVNQEKEDDVFGRRRPSFSSDRDRFFRPSHNYDDVMRNRHQHSVYYPIVPERHNNQVLPPRSFLTGGSGDDRHHIHHRHREGYLPPFTSLAEAAKGNYPDHSRRRFPADSSSFSSSSLDRELEERRRLRQRPDTILVRRRGSRKVQDGQ